MTDAISMDNLIARYSTWASISGAVLAAIGIAISVYVYAKFPHPDPIEFISDRFGVHRIRTESAFGYLSVFPIFQVWLVVMPAAAMSSTYRNFSRKRGEELGKKVQGAFP
ncbi:hypothetical protein [Bradyrhizobium sp. 2TAF24]|uniref:hypothetical protein n=1 Tax=Bradyrhizobium sp. 2TAF24 TaxID=3233011 RepID=UPI003F931A42